MSASRRSASSRARILLGRPVRLEPVDQREQPVLLGRHPREKPGFKPPQLLHDHGEHETVRVAVALKPGYQRAQAGKLQEERRWKVFDDVIRQLRERPVGPRHAGRRLADSVFELDRQDFVWRADLAAHLGQRLVPAASRTPLSAVGTP